MKRLTLALALSLATLSPALATNLLNVVLTAAVATTTTAPLQLRRTQSPSNVTVNCIFTYGSGGTSADAWVQTSLDGGTTWIDIAQCHALLANLNQVFNLTNLTAVTSPLTPTDGTLAANTSVSGVFGTQWRVKYSSAGTYAGNTRLVINAFATGGLTQ